MEKVAGLLPFESELKENVSADKLMEFTRDITKEIRMSGSPEELRSFEYVKEQLESFGLETEMLFSENLISLPGKAMLKVNDTDIKCITHSLSKPVKNLESIIVDVGNGSDDDYQNNDVEGKVVLVTGLATPDGVQKAESYGVAAAIFIHAKHTHEMIVSPVWGTPVPKTAPYLPHIPVVSVNSENGEAIRKLVEDGKNKCCLTTEVDTDFRTIPTLVAEIKGTEEPDKFVLLSGHIDAWHYGVMDNGTANATMVEIARILSQYRANLKRTLRIAFWSGHSHGRYAGSTWYCDNHWEDLNDNCVLHINVDSVGAKDATVLTNANCMKETKGLAKEVIFNVTGEKFEGSRHGRSGDHSFWGTGTPSLFMGLSEQEPSTDPSAAAFARMFNASNSGGFGWWWHTTEDTIDKIDPKFLKRDCEIYLISVYRSLTDSILPINQYAAVEDIEKALIDWQEKADLLFDLSSSIERVKKLKKIVKEFDERVLKVEQEDKGNHHLVNETIMALSRILVPLNYVKGSIYEHDFALTQPAIPCLQEIEELSTVNVGTDEFRFILNALNRNKNRVNFDLKKAIQITEKALHELR